MPRPWAAALQRPAAKILVAGGLTLAGWLLSGALSGSTAAAVEHSSCPDKPVVSTVDAAQHRTHHNACPQPQTSTEDTTTPASTSEPQPQATPGLLGGLVNGVLTTTAKPAGDTAQPGLLGGVLNVVGGTLNTVTSTVGGTLGTVGAVTDSVLAPLTQPPATHSGAPALLPLGSILAPVLGSGSNSGGVTVTLPAAVGTAVTPVAAPAAVTTDTPAPAAAAPVTSPPARVGVAHLAPEPQHSLPAVQDQPRDSRAHARDGGGGGTPGLPGGTTAPSAPASSVTSGHDGPGGARHPFAAHTDDATTTQLKLIGASRDHDVDGAGREAALPSTSPD